MNKNGRSSGKTPATIAPLTITPTATLETKAEVEERLAHREQVIRKATGAEFEACLQQGEALYEIRTHHYYAPRYSAFDDYCRAEQTITKTTANRYIDAFELNRDLTPIGVKLASKHAARLLAPYKNSETLGKIAEFLPKDAPTTGPVARNAIVAVLGEALPLFDEPDDQSEEPAPLPQVPSATVCVSDQAGEPKKRPQGPKTTPEQRAEAKRDDRIDYMIYAALKLSREVSELVPPSMVSFARKYVKEEHSFTIGNVKKTINFLAAIEQVLQSKKAASRSK